MISSGHTLIPAIRRRRKHRNPGIAVAFRLKGAHKKHSASNNNSSPVNFGEGFQKSEEASARKLAAGLWQWRFMNGTVFRYAPESDLRVESYDHLNCSRASIVQF